MITITIHLLSLSIGILAGFFFGTGIAFWACKDDFSQGWDCGYKCGKKMQNEEVSDD